MMRLPLSLALLSFSAALGTCSAAPGTAASDWPYSPPAAKALPVVRNAAWCRNPIDRFLLAKLEAKGLKPSPPASPTALLRRVYLDLVGVPPTPAEAEQFAKDCSAERTANGRMGEREKGRPHSPTPPFSHSNPDPNTQRPTPNAYGRLVDRLLADPRYGERWARHWLDLVRYADTDGFEYDHARAHAWRYRDYVIRSFNADKPYDRFLKEQLAGDELYPGDPEALTATGYARLGPWDEATSEDNNPVYVAQRWQDYLNDLTDTTGSVMLGLTVGCARCHDHKYDRIKQADYYRIQSFFAAVQRSDLDLPHGNDPDPIAQKAVEAKAHAEAVNASMTELREKHRAALQAEKAQRAKPGEKVEVVDREIDARIEKEDRARRDQLRKELEEWQGEVALYEPVADGLSEDTGSVPKSYLLQRGDLQHPGEEVQPAFIPSLCGGASTAPAIHATAARSTGRRSALADWIASPANPMTSRVIVNRVWQYHFGRGLVGTPSDFGRNGQPPTHPELLDWLATAFVHSPQPTVHSPRSPSPSGQWTVDSGLNLGWSLKKLHKLILLSTTYQQASTVPNPQSRTRDGRRASTINHQPSTIIVPDRNPQSIDPENRLLWRMNPMRLDAEALRDSILAVSGKLNPARGGPGVYPPVGKEVQATSIFEQWGASPEAEADRRTVYVFQRRSLMLPLVEAFDGAAMNLTCPRRAVTTIAPQALALFNGAFSHAQARFFAERLTREAGPDPGRQIELAYRIALTRPPTPAELAQARDFLARQARLQRDSGPAQAELGGLADFCLALINSNEFLYLD